MKFSNPALNRIYELKSCFANVEDLVAFNQRQCTQNEEVFKDKEYTGKISTKPTSIYLWLFFNMF